MRYSQSEKMEIIRIVEQSEIGVVRTLKELGLPTSTFYKWYGRYKEGGYDGLATRPKQQRRFWNQLPPWEREKVVEIALERPELSPRELACHITDTERWSVSESTVYRILKERGLVTSPAYIVMAAANSFKDKTTFVHQMWQTDFTYFRVVGWGWYFLSTVLDDYSRFIINWRLTTTMAASDVTATLEDALTATGLSQARVRHKPRLLSDNGPCYISGELKSWLKSRDIEHTRGAPYHPMTQGKIERYHRSMKNVVKLEHYYFPWELEKAIADWVNHYNYERYHESLDNVTPADVFEGRRNEILDQRALVKARTMTKRKLHNLQLAG